MILYSIQRRMVNYFELTSSYFKRLSIQHVQGQQCIPLHSQRPNKRKLIQSPSIKMTSIQRWRRRRLNKSTLTRSHIILMSLHLSTVYPPMFLRHNTAPQSLQKSSITVLLYLETAPWPAQYSTIHLSALYPGPVLRRHSTTPQWPAQGPRRQHYLLRNHRYI